MEADKHTSRIQVEVILDEKKVPCKILWRADEGANELSETRAINLSVWDENQQNTLRLDLWTSKMTVDDMKKFYIDILGGMSQSLLNATSDTTMSGEIRSLCDRLTEHLKGTVSAPHGQSDMTGKPVEAQSK